jgi:hypothetical protein
MISRADLGPFVNGRKVTSISVDEDGERLARGREAENAASP